MGRFVALTTRTLLTAAVVVYSGCNSTEERTPHAPAGGMQKTGVVADDSVTVDDVRNILQPREVEVEILDAQPPQDIAKIQKVVQEAITANQKWFVQYWNSDRPVGQPMPYHTNFGVTETEFKQYMDFWKNRKLVPTGNGRLKFAPQGDSRIVIENVEGLSELNGIVIDLEHDRVSTPWGTALAESGPVHISKSPIGASQAYLWRMEKDNTPTSFGTLVWFEVGRLSQTPHNYIDFRVCTVPGGTKDVDTEVTIRFPK